MEVLRPLPHIPCSMSQRNLTLEISFELVFLKRLLHSLLWEERFDVRYDTRLEGLLTAFQGLGLSFASPGMEFMMYEYLECRSGRSGGSGFFRNSLQNYFRFLCTILYKSTLDGYVGYLALGA